MWNKAQAEVGEETELLLWLCTKNKNEISSWKLYFDLFASQVLSARISSAQYLN
jgi:hypothetical protein